MRRLWLVLLLVGALGCQGGRMADSGVPEVDQTAAFLDHVVRDLRVKRRFDSAADLAAYLASAQGKAEVLPPSSALEEHFAAAYKGPRPAENVAIWHDTWDTTAFDYYILISGDDERGVVVLDAYKLGEGRAFHRWEL